MRRSSTVPAPCVNANSLPIPPSRLLKHLLHRFSSGHSPSPCSLTRQPRPHRGYRPHLRHGAYLFRGITHALYLTAVVFFLYQDALDISVSSPLFHRIFPHFRVLCRRSRPPKKGGPRGRRGRRASERFRVLYGSKEVFLFPSYFLLISRDVGARVPHG